MWHEEDLTETCENSLKDLEEDSSFFHHNGQNQLRRTVNDESIHIDGLMGKGSFASVKSATVDLPHRRNNLYGRRNSDAKYAIKSLRDSLDGSLVVEGVIDLAKEAMFLGTLRHPHIINLHGTAESPGRSDYFLVMEPLQRTLTSQLAAWSDDVQAKQESTCMASRARRKELISLMLSRVAAILGLASALSYLHEKNILYRDLKPDNIGFDRYDTVKLFDFGLATELKEVNKVGDDQYRASQCAGTPRYMASEVFFGKPYGLPADVYSFSLILYEVVTFSRAYPHKCVKDYVEEVYQRKKRPKLDRTIPKNVKTWMKTGWKHKPNARPKMADLCREMTEYLSTKGHCNITEEGSLADLSFSS